VPRLPAGGTARQLALVTSVHCTARFKSLFISAILQPATCTWSIYRSLSH